MSARKYRRGAGCYMAYPYCTPNTIQPKTQMGKQIGQRYTDCDVIKKHQAHALGRVSHSVEQSQAAVCNGIEDVANTDDPKISFNNGRHIAALDK